MANDGSRLLLLMVVALAPCAAANAAEDEPFAGCKITNLGPPTIRVTCGADALDVTDALPGERDGAFIAGVISGLVHSSPKPVEQTELRVEIGGMRLTAVRVVSGGTRQWILATLPRSEGRRMFMCREVLSPTSRCTAWFEAAASWAWRSPPASIPRAIVTAAIAGKPYQAPEGCEIAPAGSGFMVECPDGIVLWSELPAPSVWDVERVFRAMAPGFTQPMPRKPCWLDGTPTHCVTRANSDGSTFHVSEVVTLRGKPMAAVCMASLGARGLPKACEAILSFQPPGP